MSPSIADLAPRLVANRIGVAVSASLERDGDGVYLEVAPTDLSSTEGFVVRMRLGWRSAEATLLLGRFSKALVEQMAQASQASKDTFAGLVSALSRKGVKASMKTNGAETDPISPSSWPSVWSSVELQLRRTPIEVEPGSHDQHQRLASELVVPMFAMVVALMGAEEDGAMPFAESEGASREVVVNRYERSRLNRELCIQLQGAVCKVCSFDFAQAYGPLGEGFIEVHHVTPVSSMGEGFRVDVERDLVPLCSNCHAMVHRQTPPLEVAQLRLLMETHNIEE
jgi:5-methylcytosine-specific restriction protein A